MKYTKFYLSSEEVGSYAKFSLGNKGTRFSEPDEMVYSNNGLVDNHAFIIGNKSPLGDLSAGSDLFDGINSTFVDLVMGCYEPNEVEIDSSKLRSVSSVTGLKSNLLGITKSVDAEICPLHEYNDNPNENNCSVGSDPKLRSINDAMFPAINIQDGSEHGSLLGYFNGMFNHQIIN